MSNFRVLVADDNSELRESFVATLRDHGIDVVGSAPNGSEAIRLARLLRPDFVLMDLRMPVMDGIKATRKITEEGLPCIVVMMTAYEDDSLVREATDAGASGYLVKGTPVSDAIRALEAIVSR